MPATVSAISRSSLYAGTTTATRLPSSTSRGRYRAGRRARRRATGSHRSAASTPPSRPSTAPTTAEFRLLRAVVLVAAARRLGAHDLAHRGRVRLHAREHAAADGERRPEADDGLRAIGLRAAD